MRQDVLSKIREIVRCAEHQSYANASLLAQELRRQAITAGETSPFCLLDTRGGNADGVTSLLTVTKHVEFCAELRLIQFYEGGLLPYAPLVKADDGLDRAIARELWSYLTREGVGKQELKRAMRSVRLRDPLSIWGQFNVRRISRDNFRRCLYLLSQLPGGVVVSRKWTYDLEDEAA